MKATLAMEIEGLAHLAVRDLKHRYHLLFGEQPNTHNKDWLVKRIAWRLQVRAEGDISERARARALAIADDADLRIRTPKQYRTDTPAERTTARAFTPSDERLPLPGAVLTRKYKGQTHQVLVLEDGFLYEDQRFTSLSAVARAITGTRWNGFTFFELDRRAGTTGHGP